MNLSGLLFQCLIAQVHHTRSVLSPSTSTPGTQNPFTLRYSEETNSSTGPSIECPSVWYKYNSTTQGYQCIPLSSSLICDGERAYANIHHIVTYNADEGVITEVKMRYSYLRGYNTTYEGSYILLPNNVSELNRYMCDPLIGSFGSLIHSLVYLTVWQCTDTNIEWIHAPTTSLLFSIHTYKLAIHTTNTKPPKWSLFSYIYSGLQK